MKSSGWEGCPIYFMVFAIGFLEWRTAGARRELTPQNCGKIDKIKGDVRTYAPWTAAIFLQKQGHTPKFFTTGTIIGDNTVLAVARGPFGSILRGASQDEILPSADLFLVAAGLNSTEYGYADRHAQFSEVHYLEPSLTDTNSNEHYHFILYHLKTLFTFNTPYVKAICLFPESDRQAVSPFGWEFISSGFSTKNLAADAETLDIAIIRSLPQDICSTYFQFHYKRDLKADQVYCGVKSAPENQTQLLDTLTTVTGTFRSEFLNKEFCFLHGAVTVFQWRKRWFLGGIVALIPGRRQGHCDDKSVYVFGDLESHIGWIANSTECSPDRFSCGDPENTCIPLTNACNALEDCVSGRDEHERFCHAQRLATCNKGEERLHMCGVTGNCIHESQFCDGKVDCIDGSDEFQFCGNQDNNNQKMQLRNCPRLVLPEGAKAVCPEKDDCLLNTVPNSTVTLTCLDYHISPYTYSSVVLTCDGSKGVWRNNMPFSCAPECGIFPSSANSTEMVGTMSENLAWNAYIGSLIALNKDGFSAPRCSGVLIDPSFALTSARCLQSIVLNPAQIVYFLEPMSSTMEGLAWSHYLSAKQYWTYKTPWGKDVDLALIKFHDAAMNDNGLCNPVCFVESKTQKVHEAVYKTGVVVHIVRTVDMEGNQAEEIEPVKFQIVPARVCSSHFGEENMQNHVFCAKKLKGSSLLPIDAGTGFYMSIKSSVSGNYQMHLKGLAIEPEFPPRPSNDTSEYQLFLSVDHYHDWTSKVMESSYS